MCVYAEKIASSDTLKSDLLKLPNTDISISLKKLSRVYYTYLKRLTRLLYIADITFSTFCVYVCFCVVHK